MADEKYVNADEALRAALALPDASALSLTSPPAVLAKDGRLENPRFVGRGGMGTVYRARDLSLGFDVAIKLVRPGRDYAQLVRRLRREAGALALLRHPNIVELLRVDEHEGHMLLVMRFVEGVTLRRFLRARPGIDRALPLLHAAGEALCGAHAMGFVHRDFKPENVIVRPDGTPCLLDFGLTRGGTAHGAQATFTRPGEVLGTRSYMAPEQARGERTDALSDQYAFGVVAHEALTGRHPNAGAEHTDAVPHALSAVLARCMAERPEQRFPTLAEALAAMLGATPTVPSPR